MLFFELNTISDIADDETNKSTATLPEATVGLLTWLKKKRTNIDLMLYFQLYATLL
jgi:hypothetical protein